MNKLQLFKTIPSNEFVSSIMKLYGINDFNQNYKFNLQDLVDIKTLDKVKTKRDDLEKYYLKCKAKKYLVFNNEKNLITILRQLLKTQNYKLNSREKYAKGAKFLEYNIVQFEPKKKNKNQKKLIFTFH